MKVVPHHPRSFLKVAGGLLHRAEAENNMMLGLANALLQGEMTLSAAPVLVTVEDGDEVVAAALRTPPHNLLITGADGRAIDALIAQLRGDGVGLPGVMGPAESAERFARTWSSDAELGMQQTIFQCLRVAEVPAASGHFRLGVLDESPLLTSWLSEFWRMAGERPNEAKERGAIERHINSETVFVWDDGGPVSMALVGGPTDRAIRVFGVYTPPDKRNNGYATSCVAEVTQRMLDEGRAFCVLYTDATNPTSNEIYQRIGYQPVCASALWRFA